MNAIRNFSIRTKLALVTAFLLLMMFGNAMMNRQTLNKVKVLGPIYTDVVAGKDLIADILPPPAYIIESYLTSHALADAENPVESEQLIRKLQRHQEEFNQRISHWSEVLEAGELRDTLLGDARASADEYFKVAETALIPLVRQGMFEEARALVSGQLNQLYQTHHAAISKVVKLAEEHNKHLEIGTLDTLNASAWWTNAVAILVCVLITGLVCLTCRNATRRLAATRELAKALAAGDFSRRLNVSGGDEIDHMGGELSDASATLDVAINSIIRSMEAAAKHDFTMVLKEELPGELNRGKAALNAMLQNLSELHAANLERQRNDARIAEETRANVTQILDVANRVSRGDYSVEVSVTGDDALGQLGNGLRRFFAEKQKAEAAERERSERERSESEVQKQKVQQVLNVVNSIADGNFDLTIPDLGNDAVGQVARALDVAIGAIRSALLSVQSVSGTVASAASQLTSASTEISKGAQNQASSLEETASSLEEITSTVKQNTDNAQQARQLANGSRDIAEKGGAVVGEAVKAMGEINQASTKIADIITTIDEIAFQTNLLALNAAVEAARAGEQGRGFAVVAAEVRNLAQRSALAAKEIKTLIQDSVRKVENGTSLVNQSGRTLEEIVVSVKRVTDIVAEIAAASKEQLAGVEQVNKAVSQMDRVTQSNASQTEEMTGTAESLLRHSEQLNDLVSRFRLKGAVSVAAAEVQPRSTTARPVRLKSVDSTLDEVMDQLSKSPKQGYVEF